MIVYAHLLLSLSDPTPSKYLSSSQLFCPMLQHTTICSILYPILCFLFEPISISVCMYVQPIRNECNLVTSSSQVICIVFITKANGLEFEAILQVPADWKSKTNM